MITKARRKALTSQLLAEGTLSGNRPKNSISKDCVTNPMVIAVAAIIRKHPQTKGTKWLASSENQAILP